MLPSHALVDAISDAYVEVDADLVVREMNAEAERLLRADRSSALGRRLDELIADAGQSHQWADLVAAIQRREERQVAVFHPAIYRWHEVRTVPHAGMTGLLLRDVTDRQWLLRCEAERVYLGQVFHHAPVAVTLMRGPNLQIEYMNTLARQIVGARKMEGREAREALADLEQKELFDLVEDVYRTGRSRFLKDVLVTFDRKGQGEREDGWFDVSWQPVGDFDGKITGVLSISVDVTDRVRERPTR